MKSQKNLIVGVASAVVLVCVAVSIAFALLSEKQPLLGTTLVALNPEPSHEVVPTLPFSPLVTSTTPVPAITTPTPPKPALSTLPPPPPAVIVPTPLPSLPSQPQPASHLFGISLADTLTGLSSAELDKTLDDITSLGIRWIRIDFDWSVVQRENRETFDWSRLDRVVAAAAEHDLNVLGILVYTPRWARQEECNSSNRCPPADTEDFGDFSEAAATRYASLGVHTWEIWNEPNMRGSWLPGADPAEYVALLKDAYESINDVDPSAFVMTGGLGPIETDNGNIAALEYFAALYREGARPYFDAVGFHPYSFPVTAGHTASWNAWQQMANTSPSFRSIMVEHGDAEKKIWLTEYGAPTGGPGEASDGYVPGEDTDHVTEGLQAETLTNAFHVAREYAWAGPLFWYSYKDLGTSSNTIENFFGLLRHDGSPKPAYETLRELLLP